MQNLGAQACHLKHFVVRDAVQKAGLRHQIRIRGIHAVHVCINFAAVSIQGGGKSHRGQVGTAASKGRQLVTFADALEPGHYRDDSGAQVSLQACRGDAADACVGMCSVGDYAALHAGERPGRAARILQGHGDQGDGHHFSGGQKHVDLACLR